VRDFRLYSGERQTVTRFDDAFFDHRARYDYAAEYLENKNYRFGIDVFCGSGYGTAKLGEVLSANVLGIDGSTEAINEASLRFGYSNVMFAQKYFPFSLPENWADFVVSFESIEHTEHGEEFIRVVSKTVAPGGTLIISAPNENNCSLKLNPSPWHVRHYTPDEMVKFFGAYGLKAKQVLACDMSIQTKKGRVGSNYYSPVVGPLREGVDGDTCVCVFEKAKS